MDLSKFLRILPNGTNVRVKVIGTNYVFSGVTGNQKTDEFLHDIYVKANPHPLIYAIYPLYHVRELYIECW